MAQCEKIMKTEARNRENCDWLWENDTANIIVIKLQSLKMSLFNANALIA